MRRISLGLAFVVVLGSLLAPTMSGADSVAVQQTCLATYQAQSVLNGDTSCATGYGGSGAFHYRFVGSFDFYQACVSGVDAGRCVGSYAGDPAAGTVGLDNSACPCRGFISMDPMNRYGVNLGYISAVVPV